MRWLNDSEFQGERAFAAHTGMRDFPTDVRWRASDAEEGLLLSADGRLTAVMPGQTVCPYRAAGRAQADLFVFRRGGKISGPVGAGGVVDGSGGVWGGNGSLTCSLLLPRLALPAVRRIYESNAPLSAVAADIARPALRQAMERALQTGTMDPARLRARVEELAFEPMRELLIAHGLLPERFDMVSFGRTEGYHA